MIASQHPQPGSSAAPPASQGSTSKSWSQIAARNTYNKTGGGIRKTSFSTTSRPANMSHAAASALQAATNNGTPSSTNNSASRKVNQEPGQQDQQQQQQQQDIKEEKEEEEPVYVLSLKTDQAHHKAVAALRTKHFPAARLKVTAHITLFHALPGSRLSDIQRSLERIGSPATGPTGKDVPGSGRFEHRAFHFTIGEPSQSMFRLHRGKNGPSKGVGLNIAGLNPAARLRRALLDEWMDMNIPLTEQDQNPRWRGHYTIQNFAEREEDVERCERDVVRALEEAHSGSMAAKGRVEEGEKEEQPGRRRWAGGDNRFLAQGLAKGVVLWRYNEGRWVLVKEYHFSHDAGARGKKRGRKI